MACTNRKQFICLAFLVLVAMFCVSSLPMTYAQEADTAPGDVGEAEENIETPVGVEEINDEAEKAAAAEEEAAKAAAEADAAAKAAEEEAAAAKAAEEEAAAAKAAEEEAAAAKAAEETAAAKKAAEEAAAKKAAEEAVAANSDGAVSFLASKVSFISDKFKGITTKENVKKIAAAGLGAWGAATGVGWAMQNFGAGKDIANVK